MQSCRTAAVNTRIRGIPIDDQPYHGKDVKVYLPRDAVNRNEHPSTSTTPDPESSPSVLLLRHTEARLLGHRELVQAHVRLLAARVVHDISHLLGVALLIAIRARIGAGTLAERNSVRG